MYPGLFKKEPKSFDKFDRTYDICCEIYELLEKGNSKKHHMILDMYRNDESINNYNFTMIAVSTLSIKEKIKLLKMYPGLTEFYDFGICVEFMAL